MTVWVSPSGRQAVVRPVGEIDIATAPEVKSVVRGVITANRWLEHLVLDMDRVTFMDCAGMGLLTYACRSMTDIGGDLVVANVHARVMRVLNIVGLGRQPIAVFPAPDARPAEPRTAHERTVVPVRAAASTA